MILFMILLVILAVILVNMSTRVIAGAIVAVGLLAALLIRSIRRRRP